MSRYQGQHRATRPTNNNDDRFQEITLTALEDRLGWPALVFVLALLIFTATR
jgi:hypothetical protein